MRQGRALLAEVQKLFTLPATWAGLAVTVLGTLGITLLNAFSARSAIADGEDWGLLAPFEVSYAAMPLGTVGAVVIGVTIISSEYTANDAEAGGGRQVTTTLTAIPRRGAVLVAKALAALLAVVLSAAIAVPACYAVARLVIGDAVSENVTLTKALWLGAGAALYWALMGLIALSITTMVRSGLIPLIVLILNSAVVPVSLLLTNVTSLAFWLPDLAGIKLFGDDLSVIEGSLDARTGGPVMLTWAVALFTVAAVLFRRRDA